MSECRQFPNSVILTCRDVARSIAFYRDVLGFEVEACWPDEKAPMWANLVHDRQSIMVGACCDPDTTGHCSDLAADEKSWMRERFQAFQKNASGVGICVYYAVADVDHYHATIVDRGGKPATKPQTKFYGIRDFAIADPDGYQLIPYSPVTLASCQSCGMPLKEAKPGQMYCHYCTDEKGQLKPYATVLEGTIQGYFMGMMQMKRPEAEKAAREHLAKMPAWRGKG
jgi:uncharacterized glyoxalase superfamily protein PhnB